MPNRRAVFAAIGTITLGCALTGCDVASTEAGPRTTAETGTRYGSFVYETAAGWTVYEPPTGISFAEGMFEFYADVDNRGESPCLEIREVTATASRVERIPMRYVFSRERDAGFLSEQAARDGQPPISFACERVDPAISGPGDADAYSIVTVHGTTEERELVHWIKLSDGRRFRARYTGVEPAFSEHEPAVTASLATLSFLPDESVLPPLTRDEIVSAMVEQLDDERLWISDGTLRGRPLNDRHLEVLSDPAFAEVTDFNVNAQSAATGGVEVTDEGLRHLAHLPLESLCLRGSLVTDDGLVHLKDLPLKTLVLGETLIEGDGLQHLTGMKLMVIDVAGTRVGDDALVHLKDMPLLQVWIRGARVTEAGVARLSEFLPDASVAN